MERKKLFVENSAHQIQEFEICEYEEYIILAKLLSTEITVAEIPDQFNGKPVKVIGEGCFFNCTALKEILIPATVETIGAQAFALCTGLTELILSDSITEIGEWTFRDCRGLKKVVLPKNLKQIPHGMFSFCKMNDPEIILPEGLEIIGDHAFWGAGQFELFIPERVRDIGVGAFYMGPHPITELPYNQKWFSEDLEEREDRILDEDSCNKEPGGENDVAYTPIEELELSLHTYTWLKRAGVKSVKDLLMMTDEDFLHIRNLGRKSTKEVKQKLAEIGVIATSVHPKAESNVDMLK